MIYSLIANASGVTTTGAMDTTGADLLILFFGDGDTEAVSDNKSNTWVGLTAGGPGFGYGRIFYAQNPIVGTGHTFSATNTTAAVCGAAFSGSITSPFDVENGGTGLSITALSTGSITPTLDNELLISGLESGGNSTGQTIDNGFNLLNAVTAVSGTHYGAALAYKIQTTSAAINPQWTWTNAAEAVARIASFKVASGISSANITSSAGRFIGWIR